MLRHNISTLLLASACALVLTTPTLGRELTILHKFNGKDGAVPIAALTPDGQGNFYGTTYEGGLKSCECGTVFRLGPDDTLTTLHKFKGGKDGANPFGGVTVGPDGALYGITQHGGNLSCRADGCGTVFRLTLDGTKQVLHVFNDVDGKFPAGAVIFDRNGNLYGTTSGGGPSSYGTVYKISPDGEEVVLHGFGVSDGSDPEGSLIIDKDGSLYGTTSLDGPGKGGTVFKISPDGTARTLHAFHDHDGYNPMSTLAFDKAGNLYGTTFSGGHYGLGTVFRLTPSGVETVLHSFRDAEGEGYFPGDRILLDGKGNIVGTTAATGGSNWFGTVFKLAPDGKITYLASFTDEKAQGRLPRAGVVRDRLGNLYGTAQLGGSTRCSDGCGSIFRVSK